MLNVRDSLQLVAEELAPDELDEHFGLGQLPQHRMWQSVPAVLATIDTTIPKGFIWGAGRKNKHQLLIC